MIEDVSGADLADASLLAGWLFFAYGGMQFLCGPLLGNLSDAYGRRPILLLSVFGLGLDYLLTAFAPNMLWLLLGRTFAGLCGASYTTANAYLADITKPEERAKVFGYMGAAFGLGFIIGPAIGGILGEYGPRVPFFAAAGVSILNFVYGFFVLPETLPREMRRPFQFDPLQSCRRIQGFLHLQAGPSPVHHHGNVFLCHIGLSGDLGVLGHCPL